MGFDVSTLKFNDAGLIPAIAQDADNGDVLMMAWMNGDAVRATLDTGARHLLVEVASGILDQGRNQRPRAGTGGASDRLRP